MCIFHVKNSEVGRKKVEKVVFYLTTVSNAELILRREFKLMKKMEIYEIILKVRNE
jgi:hypothetical protein